MTMAVGFVCEDGIVIGADRQVTGATYTFPECKLRGIKWKNGRGIWSYSGALDTAKEFQRELESRLMLDRVATISEVRLFLKESLNVCLKKKEGFQTLFGLWIDEEWPALLLSNRADVVDAGRCEIIGWGDSALARFLRGLFLMSPGRPTLQQATSSAIYFISQAQKYDGQYVGGGTDVWSIDSNHQTRIMDIAWTGPWEKELDVMEFKTVALFGLLTHREIPAERIPQELEASNLHVKGFCAKVREGRWR